MARYMLSLNNSRRMRPWVETAQTYGMLSKMPDQIVHMNMIFLVSDADCSSNLRMDRNSFDRLYFLLRELGGLVDHRYVSVEEQVSIFLSILAHHKKNKVVKFDYQRSGQTVSHYVHTVLKAVLGMHTLFLVQPTPVPDDSTDPGWKLFKGHISMNVLGVCDRSMRFVYVLPGWEGSAADYRVLRVTVIIPNRLKVPKVSCLLTSNLNLFPIMGTATWEILGTQTMRVFLSRTRFGILRSVAYYSVKTQVRLIITCFILHNFIRSDEDVNNVEHVDNIDGVKSTPEWNLMREELSIFMFNQFESRSYDFISIGSFLFLYLNAYPPILISP
ncbi:hypothetical protein ACS0TY_035146 [Phlomoides rotata]